MSKKSKAVSKQNNLNAKRAQKAANKAKYESWKRLGENTKSGRNKRKNANKKSKFKGQHLVADCGNIACRKCYKVTNLGVYPINRPFSVRGALTLKKAA